MAPGPWRVGYNIQHYFVPMNRDIQPPRTFSAAWASKERLPRAQESKDSSRLNSLQVIGFYCAFALVFLRFSFFSDFLTYLTGKQTYVLYVFGPPALLAFLMRRGLQRTFREVGPKLWLGFVVWMFLSVPFSIWRGGSSAEAISYVKTIFVLLLFTVGLTVDWAQCRKLVYAIAAAAVFNVAVGIYFMRSGEERFSFSWTTSIGNSNDFAAHLLMILPFLLFVVLRPSSQKLVRAVCAGAMLLGLYEILRTASRGALIAIVVVIIVVLLRGSARQRVLIGAMALIALAVLIKFLPSETWNRMLSFSDDAGASKEALESSDIRKHLLEESIKCTFEHPLLGIGVGQFGYYESGVRGAQPGHVDWRPTHNSYTEISSECGLGALFFYLAALMWAFRLLGRVEKQANGPDKDEMVRAAYAIRLGVIGYSVAIFFVNFGYAFEFILVSGLIEAIWRVVRENGAPATVAVGAGPITTYSQRLAASKSYRPVPKFAKLR